MQLQCEPLFLISMETEIQLIEKENICRWILTASKGYSGHNYFIRIISNRRITSWSFLICWIHCPLVLALTGNTENADTVVLLFKEVLCSIKCSNQISTLLYESSEAAIKRNSSKRVLILANGCKFLKNTCKFHFVSKVASRIFLRMNFFIHTFEECC